MYLHYFVIKSLYSQEKQNSEPPGNYRIDYIQGVVSIDSVQAGFVKCLGSSNWAQVSIGSSTFRGDLTPCNQQCYTGQDDRKYRGGVSTCNKQNKTKIKYCTLSSTFSTYFNNCSIWVAKSKQISGSAACAVEGSNNITSKKLKLGDSFYVRVVQHNSLFIFLLLHGSKYKVTRLYDTLFI